MAIRRRKIEALIDELLEEHDMTEAPVSVAEIAEANGARIFYKSLKDDTSGFLYRDKDHSVIGVNTHHARVRQNFTMAHELGHLLLHDQEQLHVDRGGFALRLRNDVSKQGTDEYEREANFFAASLLMPRTFIERDLAEEETVDLLDESFLNKLAKKYEVSTQALVNRLKNLGY